MDWNTIKENGMQSLSNYLSRDAEDRKPQNKVQTYKDLIESLIKYSYYNGGFFDTKEIGSNMLEFQKQKVRLLCKKFKIPNIIKMEKYIPGERHARYIMDFGINGYNNSYTSWSTLMCGMPGTEDECKIWYKYKGEIDEKTNYVRQKYLELIEEHLLFLYPSIKSIKIPLRDLIKMGLPEEEYINDEIDFSVW